MIGAQKDDWVVIADRAYNQRGRIVRVYSADGTPPYLVRWCDDGRETLLFAAGVETRLVTAVAALQSSNVAPNIGETTTRPKPQSRPRPTVDVRKARSATPPISRVFGPPSVGDVVGDTKI